ncbi:unnamed protein product [Cochlearia groenlandica]
MSYDKKVPPESYPPSYPSPPFPGYPPPQQEGGYYQGYFSGQGGYNRPPPPPSQYYNHYQYDHHHHHLHEKDSHSGCLSFLHGWFVPLSHLAL